MWCLLWRENSEEKRGEKKTEKKIDLVLFEEDFESSATQTCYRRSFKLD